MPYLRCKDLVARIADGTATGAHVEGVALRTNRAEWERRKVTDDDVVRVRDALGDDAAGARIVPFVASTPRRADDGFVLPPSGCDLTRFAKNPGVFWQHSTWSSRPRIGDAVAWIDGDVAVRSLVSFIGRELSQALDNGFGWAIGELAAARGHAMSIGFDILAANAAPDDVRKQIPWALDVVLWVLLEESLVHIGADEDAVSDARSRGMDVEPLAQGFARMLDEMEGSGVTRATLERAWLAAARSRSFSLPSMQADPAPTSSTNALLAAIREGLSPLGQLPRG